MAQVDFLKKVNNIKSFTKVSELKVDEEYLIEEAKIIETKYGKSIKVTFDDNTSVFLPKRYSVIKKSELKLLEGLSLVYKGKDEKMDLIEFRNNEE